MNGEEHEAKTTNDVEANAEQAEEEVESTVSADTKVVRLKAIGVNAVTLFCRQLSTLVDVGIPLLKCLQILYQRTSQPKLQAIIHEVSQDIEQGTSFSDALEKYPRVFSPFFVNMTKVAEKGGSLDESLRIVADVMEKEDVMKQKVKEALFYPVVTLLVGVFVVGILIAVVIPMFGNLYAQQDFDLPWPTEVLLTIGDPQMFWVWILLIGGVILFLIAYSKSHGSKAFYDRYKLKAPIFGPLFMKLYVARFARNFGTLIRGGVPLLQALDVMKETSENMVFAEAIDNAVQYVERGGRLEQPLREADVFPDVVVDMVAIGEEAGKLDLMLFKIAELYDGEVDRTVNTLASSLQPILIVILGFLTAFIAAAMFWPYFRMTDFLGTGF
ncbi:type II secretion system F family protein [candidate division KSB3 bacterium]|uniref:Type II secretion system F family protein n=1 Tax=candidate division KSB3 bacterium TaxID=2044937 RepID=A0A9D5Q4H3_9BACT|nr:type II secretion system F family protein [candidate division KSB3 bacterium]MBD3323187.1 type II secretion system F family protein [candidate division KSB3 bacterium]